MKSDQALAAEVEQAAALLSWACSEAADAGLVVELELSQVTDCDLPDLPAAVLVRPKICRPVIASRPETGTETANRLQTVPPEAGQDGAK